MEAEINALAHCCRKLFSVMDMVTDVGTSVGLPINDITSMCVSSHEDKAGGCVLT